MVQSNSISLLSGASHPKIPDNSPTMHQCACAVWLFSKQMAILCFAWEDPKQRSVFELFCRCTLLIKYDFVAGRSAWITRLRLFVKLHRADTSLATGRAFTDPTASSHTRTPLEPLGLAQLLTCLPSLLNLLLLLRSSPRPSEVHEEGEVLARTTTDSGR